MTGAEEEQQVNRILSSPLELLPVPAGHEIAAELLALPERIAEAERIYTEANSHLQQAEAALILGGAINGSNTETRKAQLASRLADFEQEAADRRNRLHLLQNRFAALRSVARILSGDGNA